MAGAGSVGFSGINAGRYLKEPGTSPCFLLDMPVLKGCGMVDFRLLFPVGTPMELSRALQPLWKPAPRLGKMSPWVKSPAA